MKKIFLSVVLLFSSLVYCGNTGDYQLDESVAKIYKDYGDKVSLQTKSKGLFKFGRNESVSNSAETIWSSPAANETYLTDNLINSIVSTSVSDSQLVVIEGHTISGGDFAFTIQTVQLQGRTVVALSTNLARSTRAYNNSSTDFTGTISITETDTYTNGVPDTDSKVHLTVPSGQNQSEKASTTISSVDYWIITSLFAQMITKQSSFAEIFLEVRLKDKVFRTQFVGGVSDANELFFEFDPYLIVPKNSDVRIRAISDAAGGRDVAAGIQGYLAIIE